MGAPGAFARRPLARHGGRDGDTATAIPMHLWAKGGKGQALTVCFCGGFFYCVVALVICIDCHVEQIKGFYNGMWALDLLSLF